MSSLFFNSIVFNNIYVDYVNICLWQLYSRKGDFMENKLKQIDERNSEPRDGQGAAQWLLTCRFVTFPRRCKQ